MDRDTSLAARDVAREVRAAAYAAAAAAAANAYAYAADAAFADANLDSVRDAVNTSAVEMIRRMCEVGR